MKFSIAIWTFLYGQYAKTPWSIEADRAIPG